MSENGDNWRDRTIETKPPSDLAYRDRDGNWRAGPDSDIKTGTYIAEGKAKQIRAPRHRENSIKGIMHNQRVERDEAEEIYKELRDRLEQAQDEDERREIRREILGYG